MTVLLLHDEEGDENDLVPVGRALAPCAEILSPRITGKTAKDVAEWLGQRPGVYALGYAGGATIAVTLLLHHPGTLAGALLLRPGAVAAPVELPDLKSAPVLISGSKDDHDAEIVGCLLSSAGAHVDIAIQNADRNLTPADFSLGRQWFARLAKPR